MLRRITLVAAAIAFAIAAGTTAFAQDPQKILRVHLDGFRSNNGKPHCSIFNDAAAFPSDGDKALKTVVGPGIKNSAAEVDFTGLAPGKYAIVCFHDENSNGKFDENMLGMPKEGYCFSNNVKPLFSAPKFPECSFDYKGGDQSISITMIY